MLFFLYAQGLAGPLTDIVTEHPPEGVRHLSRAKFKSFLDAARVAEQANAWAEANGKPDRYVATDEEPGRTPQFDVIRLFAVGDDVSYTFNGDSYPDGKVVHVGTGPRMTIRTSGSPGRPGHTYYRRNHTGSWYQQGGTWRLIEGTHSKLSPEF